MTRIVNCGPRLCCWKPPADLHDPETRLACRTDGDINGLAQGDQKSHQTVHREVRKASSMEGANLGLAHPKQLCSFRLGESSTLDDGIDMASEFGLGNHLIRIRETEVGKDVTATGFTLGDSFCAGLSGIHDIPLALPSSDFAARVFGKSGYIVPRASHPANRLHGFQYIPILG